MGRSFKLVPEQRAIWMVALPALAALAAGTVWLALAREAPLRYAGVVRIELPLPPGSAPPSPAATGLSAGPQHVESVRPDLALLEDGPFGPLPRIAPDGRRPFLAYARPFNLEDRRPKVAVLLVGLGQQREIVDAVLTLPAPISLQFSAYTPELPALVARARSAGHGVLLELPMEPADYPPSDLGPHTLLSAGGRDENLARLDWVLARASGYVALAGGGAGFAGSAQAEPVLDVLARRGLALIELGDRQLAPVAAGAGLPYVSARRTIDENPSGPAIDRALAALEAEASATGSALGVARGHPMSLERLRQWATTLEAKGLVLAPASAVLIEQAGLAGELATDPPRAAARSEG
jgi:polysaccharide deacetylase 2 family uncharacterized protein YibQ